MCFKYVCCYYYFIILTNYLHIIGNRQFKKHWKKNIGVEQTQALNIMPRPYEYLIISVW